MKTNNNNIMENTNDNKIMFFYLYSDQNVIMNSSYVDKYTPYIHGMMERDDSFSYACLRDLKTISNEDALYIAKITFNSTGKHRIKYGKSIINAIIEESAFIGCYSRILHVYDYLRAKGYAIPWMGITVETMIKWGWIKLNKQPAI